MSVEIVGNIGIPRNSNHVRVFDTTLRDGMQAIGVHFDSDAKVEIAVQLASMGVDIIEAGFPASGKGDFEAVRAVAVEVGGAAIAALCRAVPRDVEQGFAAIEPADKKLLHIFASTSVIQMNQQGKTSENIIEETRVAVSQAKSLCDEVEFSPMDASRSDFGFMIRVCMEAADHGATVINIPDTTGYMDHRQYGQLIAAVRQGIHQRYPDIIISAHVHNDRDDATASTLEAVAAGARQVEVSVNGIGSRPGNAKLAPVVSAIYEGVSYIPRPVFTTVDTRELTYVSQLVADLSGRPLPDNEPITGRYAFAHGEGIHQDGVDDDPNTFECLKAEDYGQIAGEIVLTSLSGKSGVRNRLKAVGYKPGPDELRAITRVSKDFAAEQGRDLADTDIERIMAESRGEAIVDSIRVEDIKKVDNSPLSEIVLIDKGETIITPVDLREDAIDNAVRAINQALAFDGKVRDWHGDALGEGSEAEAGAFIDVVRNGHSVKAYAKGKSVDKAAINAYVAAINLIRRIEEHHKF